MVINLRHFFILIIIVNIIAVLFFFSYRGKGPSSKKLSGSIIRDPSLQKLDTKNLFGRRDNVTPAKRNFQNKTVNPRIIKPKTSRKKLDPIMNYNIFQNLSLYYTLPARYFNDDPNLKMSYSTPNMGLINEDDYCLAVDQQNINNPGLVLNSMAFMTDYNADGLARQLVMKKMGIDTFPDEVSKDMNKTLWDSV